MDLYDQHERVHRGHASHGEDAFTFLNRAAGVYWDRVRALHESWFSRFPTESQADVRSRFRSGDLDQMQASFWELYLNELLNMNGYKVERDPIMKGTTRRPDFRASAKESSFVVEATSATDSMRDRAADNRLRRLLDALDSLRSIGKAVHLEVLVHGSSPPPARRIANQVQKWLDSLGPLPRWEDGASFDTLPQLRLESGDWRLEFHAMPAGSASRPLGSWAGHGARAIDTAGPLRDKLLEKATAYGRDFVEPYLIAVTYVAEVAMFADVVTISRALYGLPEIRQPGLWKRADGSPRNQHVSAVVVALGLSVANPRAIMERLPALWRNSDTYHSLDTTLSLPLCTVDDGKVKCEPPPRSAHDLFGVAPDWPGPEQPFSD